MFFDVSGSVCFMFVAKRERGEVPGEAHIGLAFFVVALGCSGGRETVALVKTLRA